MGESLLCSVVDTVAVVDGLRVRHGEPCESYSRFGRSTALPMICANGPITVRRYELRSVPDFERDVSCRAVIDEATELQEVAAQ